MAGVLGEAGILADLVLDAFDLDDNGVPPLHQTGCQIGASAGLGREGGEQTALNVASRDQRGELGVAITDIDGANDRAHINPLEG